MIPALPFVCFYIAQMLNLKVILFHFFFFPCFLKHMSSTLSINHSTDFPFLCALVAQSCSTLCNLTDWPTRLLCPWDSPGENIGVGCHFLLQFCYTIFFISKGSFLSPFGFTRSSGTGPAASPTSQPGCRSAKLVVSKSHSWTQSF